MLEDGGATDGAMLEYEQVLRLGVADETAGRRLAAIWVVRADDALSRGDVSGAGEAFRRALPHEPREESAARVRTVVASRAEEAASSGHFSQGADLYTLMLDLLPDDDEVKSQAAGFLFRCGDALERQGELEAAVSAYAKVAELQPHSQEIVLDRLAAARGMLEERQTIATVFARAMAAHRSGNMTDAREGWKALIQRDVLSYEGHNVATLLAETVAVPADTRPAPGGSPAPLERDEKEEERLRAPENENALSTRAALLSPVKGARAHSPAGTPRERAHQKRQPRAVSPPVAADDAASAAAERPPAATADPGAVEAPSHAIPGGIFDNDTTNTERPLHAWVDGRMMAVGGAMAVAFVIFLLWPASITSVSISSGSVVVKPKSTVDLWASASYNSYWRRGSGYLPQSDYTWTSSDSTVATVDWDGTVTGVGLGTAWITATAKGVSGEARVSVAWDVPAMQANVTAVRFYAADAILPVADRKYASTFDSKNVSRVWVELSIDVGSDEAGRALTAPMSHALYRNYTLVSRQDFAPVLEKDWRSASWTGALDFGGAVTPGNYRVDIEHGDRTVASGSFTVE